VLFDECGDRQLQGCNTAVNAAAVLAVGQQRKEAFDLIEPRGTGRCQMRVPARSAVEPIADDRRLVGSVIVNNQMD
jgi:hypothetical protein